MGLTVAIAMFLATCAWVGAFVGLALVALALDDHFTGQHRLRSLRHRGTARLFADAVCDGRVDEAEQVLEHAFAEQQQQGVP